jgi:phage protein D
MSDNTQPGIHSARPTINIAGQNDNGLSEGLQRLEIYETIQGLYRCEAVFANWGSRNGHVDYLYFDRSKLDFGVAFKAIWVGDTIFEGRIMAMEASFPEADAPQITVLAEDRFQDLRMTRRTRSFADMSDSDVVQQVASEHGLQASVNMSGPTHKALAQVNQSDLAFLRDCARSLDAELWMDGTTLNAETRASRRGSPLELTQGHELRSFVACADLASQRTTVSANGWDVAAKAALNFQADDSTISQELNGDTSGVSILKSAFGQRDEAISHTVPFTTDEAQNAAQSYFKACARRFVVGHGVAETQSELRVGAVVNLKNLGPLFSGQYYLVEVRHRFDSRMGIRTEFVGERAGLGSSSS